MIGLLHQDIVDRMAIWLRGTKRATVVIKELVTMNSETPDVIGFRCGQSFLVECKTSKADFKRDQRKFFRRMPEYGMGDYRYYAAPAGVLTIGDLPEGWGLVEIGNGRRIRCLMESGHFSVDKRKEVALLVSFVSRKNETKKQDKEER